jgi:hypothetical protein
MPGYTRPCSKEFAEKRAELESLRKLGMAKECASCDAVGFVAVAGSGQKLETRAMTSLVLLTVSPLVLRALDNLRTGPLPRMIRERHGKGSRAIPGVAADLVRQLREFCVAGWLANGRAEHWPAKEMQWPMWVHEAGAPVFRLRIAVCVRCSGIGLVEVGDVEKP